MDGQPLRLEASYRGRPVTFEATPLGADLLVVLAGGEKAHIGSIVLAEPRPSTADPASRSVTTQVWNRPPHKEEAVARPVAETLARRLGATVMVVSGIHFADLDAEGLEAVSTLCRELLERYLSLMDDD